MADQEKTRDELIEEIALLKERIQELERRSAAEKRAELVSRMNEEQLRVLNDNLSVGVALIDRDMKVLMVNKKMREMFPEADYSGHPFCYQAFNDPSGKEPCEGCPVVKAFEDNGGVHITERVAFSSDGIKHLKISATGITDPDGKVSASIEMVEDITDHRRALEALRESEERFRTAMENLPAGLFVHDLEGRLLFVNETSSRNTGYSRDELLSISVGDIDRGDIIPPERENLWEDLKWGKTIIFESQHLRKDGSLYPVEIRLSPITMGGTPVILALANDITERRRAEADLASSLSTALRRENETRSLLKASRAVLECSTFAESARRIFDACREATGAVSGYVALLSEDGEENEVLFLEAGGLPCNVNPSLPMPVRGLRGEAYGKCRVVYENDFMNSEWVSFMPHGHVEMQNVMFAPLTISGKVVGVIGLANKPGDFTADDARIAHALGDIAAIALSQSRAEEALRKSEEKYRGLVAALPQAVYESDTNGSIQYVNQVAFEMFGFDHTDFSPGKHNVLQMIAPEDRERAQANVKNMLSTGKSPSTEYMALRKDGSKFPVLIYSTRIMHEGIPAGMRGIIIDITERKHAEEERKKLEGQLAQAQKMESVGRLAGGVAHDFNNMLGVILGHTELALGSLKRDNPLYYDLAEIGKAARRSSELTRQLLGYARRQTISPKVLDLNRTVERTLKMLRRLIGEDIDLAWHPGKFLWPVNMDPSQLDQILANLCVNARDAISGIGNITIETENVTLDENYCADRVGFEPGDYVMLAVSDDGSGIEKAILQSIFDPFFTTKDVGKGTGLGLSTVYGIVKQNGGYINVYSEPGEGTTFKIYIPRHIEKALKAAEKSEDKPPVGGTETVLLVEDEPMLLEMGKAMLERFGYQVLAAGSPAEAMEIADEHKGGIDLLITDVVMPEMNGRDLAARLQSLCPGISTLFMSGYTANVIAHHGVLEKGVHFMQKPFSMKDLAVKVREALSRGKALI